MLVFTTWFTWRENGNEIGTGESVYRADSCWYKSGRHISSYWACEMRKERVLEPVEVVNRAKATNEEP